MRKHFVIPFTTLFFLLLFSTCIGPGALVKLSNQRYLDTEGFYETVAFGSRSRLITLPVYANDQDIPLDLVWDTGASYSVVTADVVARLQVDTVTTISIRDSQGNSKPLPVVLIDSLKIGNVVFKETLAVVADYGPDNPLICVAPDGILGANVMQLCHWKVDYEDSTFTITDDWSRFTELEGQEGQNMSTHPFMGQPKISYYADSTRQKRVLMDSGFGGFIDINDKAVPAESTFWQDRAYASIERNNSFGLFGSSKYTNKSIIIDTLIFGGQTLYNVPADVEPNSSKLGNNLFSYFDMYYNFTEKQYYLLPNSKDRVVENKKTVGATPFYTTPDYFIIRSLTEDSPATEAGFALGDTITHVNGKRPGEWFTSYCHFFLNTKEWLTETDTVTFLKKGSTQPVALVKRPAF